MNAELIDLLAAASLEPDARIGAQKVLPRILKYAGAERGSLFLLSGNRVIHRLLANKESFAEVADYKVSTVLAEGLAGWALKHRQGALASDTQNDDRWVALGDDKLAGSAIVVPMTSRGHIIGLVSLHHTQRGYFRERHLALAAEASLVVAPILDAALLTASTIDALVQLCADWPRPATLLTWAGQVKTVNPAMAALDIVWEGVDISQSVLARELAVTTAAECSWDGERALANLPYRAQCIQFQGAGLWIRFVPR